MTRLRLPVLDSNALPDLKQRLAAYQLIKLFPELRRYAEQFAADLSLYDDCVNRAVASDKYRERLLIACRDGALALFHFEITALAVGAAVHAFKELQALMPTGVLRATRKQFLAVVPDAQNSRHGAAHAAEFSQNQQVHAVQGGFGAAGVAPSVKSKGSVYVSEYLDPMTRRFSTTVKGRLVGYEITQATLDVLTTIVQSLYDAIEGAHKKLVKANAGAASEPASSSTTEGESCPS